MKRPLEKYLEIEHPEGFKYVQENRVGCKHCKDTGFVIDHVNVTGPIHTGGTPHYAGLTLIDYCECRLGWEQAQSSTPVFFGTDQKPLRVDKIRARWDGFPENEEGRPQGSYEGTFA
jgi:hypothetical protein